MHEPMLHCGGDLPSEEWPRDDAGEETAHCSTMHEMVTPRDASVSFRQPLCSEITETRLNKHGHASHRHAQPGFDGSSWYTLTSCCSITPMARVPVSRGAELVSRWQAGAGVPMLHVHSCIQACVSEFCKSPRAVHTCGQVWGHADFFRRNGDPVVSD